VSETRGPAAWHNLGMRALERSPACVLASALALALGASACAEDPIEGVDDTETGDGDGDGDGDVEPETVVFDLYNETCQPTATWTSVTVGLMPIALPCDMVGLEANGWTVRFVERMVGELDLDRIIALVTGLPSGQQIRGTFDLGAVADPQTLEFRADLLLVCGEGDGECAGRFALAITEGTDGPLTEIQDRQLTSGTQPIEIMVPLDELQSFLEPSVVVIAERTEPGDDPSPELLLIKPRLVLP
jgi:hypothetical protein